MKIIKLNFMIFLIQHCCANKDILPMLMLDYHNILEDTIDVPPNPFVTITSAKFASIVLETIRRSKGVIIFIEELLSFEDITAKDEMGTPFNHLHKGLIEKKVKFFPAVLEPYKVLSQMFLSQDYNTYHLDNAYNLPYRNDKHIYVFFNNYENETRTMAFRRHDSIINNVYINMQQLLRGPVVAFYTGKLNPAIVETSHFISIEPIPVVNDLDVTIISEAVMLRFSGVAVATSSRRAVFNEMPIVAEETWNRRKLSTKIAYTDFELEFNFDLTKEDEWLLESVALLEAGEEVGRTAIFARAPWNRSYICGEPLQIVNMRDGSSISIPRYQIQPLQSSVFFRNGSSNNTFGPPVNCCPYFSIPILSCLFVSFICFAILAQGIVMISNCAPNSKFDDPSSVPLVHESH